MSHGAIFPYVVCFHPHLVNILIMPLELRPTTETDVNQWTLTAIEAFQSGIGHLLTGTNTPDNVAKKNASTVKTLRGEPEAKIQHVVDTETGAIVAGAFWYIYESEQTEEKLNEILAKPTPEQGYREDFEPIYSHLKDNRREIMGTRPYVYLNVLFTSPKHHRRGAGAMMIKWGVDKADELGLEAYHESSIEAKPLYERFGYKAIKEVKFDMAEYGRPDLGVDTNYIMYRKPQAQLKN